MEPGIAPGHQAVTRSSADIGELATAMAGVLKDTQAVKKSGFNKHHGYAFATAADVQNEARQALAKHGLGLIVSPTNWQEGDRQGKQRRILLTLTIRLIHSSGQWMETDWFGEGQDAGDKAFYKAYTAALKYWSICTFLVPTGIDPEADTDTDRNAEQQNDRRSSGPPPGDDWRQEVEQPPAPTGPMVFDGYSGTWDDTAPDYGGISLDTYGALVGVMLSAGWDLKATHQWMADKRGIQSLNNLDEPGAQHLLTGFQGKWKREQEAAQAAQAEADAEAAAAVERDTDPPEPADASNHPGGVGTTGELSLVE